MSEELGGLFSQVIVEDESGKETPSPEVKPTVENSPAEKPTVQEPVAEKPKEEATEKPKVEVKPEEKKEPEPDWKTEATKAKKQWQDTVRWANENHRKSLELEKHNKALIQNVNILSKKIDGTYDETKDGAMQSLESLQESPEIFKAEAAGRAKASLSAAYAKYGEEPTNALLRDYVERFGGDVFVQQRILAAEMPVEEAITAVKLAKFFDQYGNSPDAVIKAIEAELTPKIRETEKQKLMETLKKKKEEPKGLAGISEASSAGTKVVPALTDLKSIFG